ncbi:hypothetical protein [Phycicoccus avicenniae]|uniref:hypothetical protein n=1 Tax=Phycicoccus avicenniae TaxID=2828860 RepID=UPI003D287F08
MLLPTHATRARRAVPLAAVLGLAVALTSAAPAGAVVPTASRPTVVPVPAAADPVPRDALVIDLLTDSRSYGPRASSAAWDSAAGTGPTVSAGTLPGGVKVVPTNGVGVEIIPPDSGRLAVGTHTKVPGLLPIGARTTPVIRLSKAVTDCQSFSSTQGGTLTVDEVSYTPDGTLSSLAATFLMPCYPSSTGSSIAGVVRVRSTADYTAASSVSTILPAVVSGSRTPYGATLRNLGTVPMTLGQAAAVPVAADQPRVEPVPGADGCSGTTLAVGASCDIRVEYVDDGIPGGGSQAWLAIPARGTVRGAVRIGLSVQSVIETPGAPQSLTTDAGYDGVSMRWTHDSSAPLPDGFRIRRTDGPEPVLLGTRALHETSFVDTALGPGESATYVVSAYTAAGEAAADPVTVTRPDLPDPPDADAEQAMVIEADSGSSVLRDGTATPLGSDRPVLRDRVSELAGSGTILGLPRFPGPGTYEVGETSAYQVSLISGPSTCSALLGTAVVREAWVRADGTVHRLDADLHLSCVGRPVEVQVRYGVATPFAALEATPGSVGGDPFAGVVVGETSAPVTVTLHNAGSGPLGLGDAAVGGDDASSFGLGASTCGAVLAVDERCTVEVVHHPVRTGTTSAVLRLPAETPNGGLVLQVAGSAQGGPPPWTPRAVAVLGRVSVQWYAGGDGGSPVTTIGIERATGEGSFVRVGEAEPGAGSWVDPDVTAGTTYRYRLVVTNRHGSTPTPPDDEASVVAADEELLLAAGWNTGDLVSAPLGDGPGVAHGSGQDVDAPAVSPDGRLVAYTVYDADLAASLWVRSVEPGGPAPRLLADDPAADELDPVWSPDGSRVCWSQVSAGAGAVWCRGLAPEARAAAYPGGQGAVLPSFLPDGTALVAVTVDGPTSRLVRIGATGTRTTLAGSDGAFWPAVSPRGDVVAFTRTGADGVDQVRTLPIGGGASTVRVSGFVGVTVFGRPAWAPAGDALAVPTWLPWSADSVTVWRADPHGGAGTTTVSSPAGAMSVSAVAWRRLDEQAPAITFPSAPALTATTSRIPVRVTDDTVPVGGLTVTCRLDGKPTAACSSGWSGTVAAGSHTLTVTATDPFGRVSTASHRWTVDGAAPTVAVTALPVAVLGSTVTVTYGASDTAGVSSYDVRVRSAAWSSTAFSAHSQPAAWSGRTARSVTVSLASGTEYCFSVRARDRVGNTSAWSAERCTARALDDRALAAGTGWTRAGSSSASAGTVTRTTTAGRVLTRTRTVARRVLVVATTCPTCGTLDVFLGSTRVGSVSTRSSTTRARQVLALPLLPSVRSGTLTLRSRTTGRLVVVDAVIARRT